MSKPADLVLHNGAVWTGDAAHRWAQAIAIRDGRFVAVGLDRDVRPLAGAHTETVDLADRMVVAGFQDAHIHAVLGGLERLRCNLTGLHSQEHYLAANHLDQETGSIEVGKLTDLAVLDRNIFDGTIQEIDEASVVLTLVEGDVVYEEGI